MQLIRDKSYKLDKASLDLNLNQFTIDEIHNEIRKFEPDVIFALAEDENPKVLDLAVRFNCHLGLFKPYKGQLEETKFDMSRSKQLAKIIFLDPQHSDIEYFENFGRVIHTNYIDECEKLLNFIFFCDADAFD